MIFWFRKDYLKDYPPLKLLPICTSERRYNSHPFPYNRLARGMVSRPFAAVSKPLQEVHLNNWWNVKLTISTKNPANTWYLDRLKSDEGEQLSSATGGLRGQTLLIPLNDLFVPRRNQPRVSAYKENLFTRVKNLRIWYILSQTSLEALGTNKHP